MGAGTAIKSNGLGERFPPELNVLALPASFASYSKPSDVYFFTSCAESEYPRNVPDIKIRGGRYIGVAGGMDHNFAYWAAHRPDAIELYDVNYWGLKLAQAKCELLPHCASYDEYANRFDRIFKGRETYKFGSLTAGEYDGLVAAGIDIARKVGSLKPQPEVANGWSDANDFSALRDVVIQVKIDFHHADILQVDLASRKDLGLLFLSDIFGLGANFTRRPEFIQRCQMLLAKGAFLDGAQIIDGARDRGRQVMLANAIE